MKKMLVMILVLALTLVGCGQSATNDTQQDGSKDEQNGNAQVVENKDTLVIAVNNTLESLNPLTENTTNGFEVLSHLYDSLIDYNKDGQLELVLAEELEVSEDGMIYSVKLKEGVMWSNGEELKASDVVFSYDQYRTSAYTGSALEMIETVEATGDYTVVITLNMPYGPFRNRMASVLILNEKAYTSVENYGDLEDYVGTGVYYPVGMEKGQRFELKRNEDYFGELAGIENVVITLIKENSTAVIALEKEEVDFVREIDAVSMELYEVHEHIGLKPYNSTEVEFITLNGSAYPTDNADFRRAIAYAFDRTAGNIVETNGVAREWDTYLVDSAIGYSADIKAPARDLDKAKEYLTKSGVPEGTEVTMMVIGARRWGEVLQRDLAEIGITLKLENVETNTGIDNLFSGTYQITGMKAGNGTNDGDILYQYYSMSSPTGFTFYENDAYDQLLIDARSSVSVEERADLYMQAQTVLRDEAVVIPIFNPTKHAAYLNGLHVSDARPDLIFRYSDFSW